MVLKGKGGKQYSLSAKPIAQGGEGSIHTVDGDSNIVAKLYKAGKANREKELKLIRMIDFPPNQNTLSRIAWPMDVLYDTGQFVGFVMRKMDINDDNDDLNVIYEPGYSAKYPDMPWQNKIIVAENLCAVLHSVHTEEHTCGDLNPKNISVNSATGHITFLDTDSYHIQDGAETYRCDVGIPEYLPREVQEKMRGGGTLVTANLPTFSKNTDNFALAIHIFQLLMNGVHPFACAIIPSQSSVVAPQPSENIIKGECPFLMNISGVKIPVFAPPITILPQNIQSLFKRAFEDGHEHPEVRPTSVEWHGALQDLRTKLVNCKKVSHHQHYSGLTDCPWCAVKIAVDKHMAPASTFSLPQTTIAQPTPPAHRPSVALPPPVQKPVTTQSLKAQSLYQLARRAKSENDNEKALHYYELAYQEDVNGWEAAFYSAFYLSIQRYNQGNVNSAFSVLHNRLSTVLSLVKNNSQATREVIRETTWLCDSSYKAMGEDFQRKFARAADMDWETIGNLQIQFGQRALEIAKIINTLADGVIGTAGNDEAVRLWKKGVILLEIYKKEVKKVPSAKETREQLLKKIKQNNKSATWEPKGFCYFCGGTFAGGILTTRKCSVCNKPAW